jgi:hypothetical protein
LLETELGLGKSECLGTSRILQERKELLIALCVVAG